jgi:hypothetical protein
MEKEGDENRDGDGDRGKDGAPDFVTDSANIPRDTPHVLQETPHNPEGTPHELQAGSHVPQDYSGNRPAKSDAAFLAFAFVVACRSLADLFHTWAAWVMKVSPPP